MYLTTIYPKAKFHGIGFSLGANVLCRYVAEEGDKCRLSSALLMGNVSIHARSLSTLLLIIITVLESSKEQ
jgi:predicted alpha/beta-fold hydrolase